MKKEAKKMVVIATIVVISAISVLMMPTIAVASEDEPRWAKYEKKWMPEDPGTNHGQVKTIAIVGLFIAGIVTLYLVLRNQIKKEVSRYFGQKKDMNSINRNQPDMFRYQMLRALFVCGYVISVVLTFVPSVRMKVGGFLGYGGEERLLSVYDLIQLSFQRGEPGLGMFLVLLFAVELAFIALALTYPKRLVFIAGAAFAGFFLLVNLFSGTPEGIENLLIPTVVHYISTILILSGFFIKPPPLK